MEDRQAIYLVEGQNQWRQGLEQQLGVDIMKIQEEGFMAAADNALPYPMPTSRLISCHTTKMVRAEPFWIL